MARRIWLALAIIGIVIGGCTKKPPPPPPPPPPAPEVYEPPPPPPEPEIDHAALRRDTIARRLAEVVTPIYFALDRSNLDTEDRSTLSAIGDVMKQYNEITLTIQGHADERGTDEYNFALGERRAQSAREYLVSYGIEASRLSTVSYGEERPAVSGSGEDVWSKNRRDEFLPSY